MPNFKFTARDPKGKWHNGMEAADSASALAGLLRTRGLSLVKAEAAEAPVAADAVQARPKVRGILPPKSLDVELGLRMMANMLEGGLTLMAALKTCAEQARRPRMAAIWYDILDRIAGGTGLADAMERHSVFPQLVIKLVRAGEVSGNLEIVLEQSADQMERKRELMVTLTSAMMYPAFTTVCALGVGAFLMMKIIPEISQFLLASGKKLPAMTQALISTSQFINAYVLQMSIIAGTVIASIAIAYRFPPAARTLDGLLLRVPIIGKMLRLAGTTLFARGLSMMLSAGVPMLTALETAGGLMRNRAIGARVLEARRMVLAGNALARPLGAGGEFMPMLPRMVAVGEETGTLTNVLDKVAAFHEKQLQATVKRMTIMIEPVMTVVVGSMVGFVYLAFFMAIYSF